MARRFRSALSDPFQHSVASAKVTVAQLDRPVGDLIGPLGTARQEFDRQAAKLDSDLSRASQTLSYALPFLGADGARTYLIAGENDAEMRDQGDVLSLALMRAQNGTFNVNTVGSVDDIEPTRAVDVSMPAGTATFFAGYQPTSLWQSVNATADFPLSAKIMQAMFAQVQGVHVDGVIALDVPALSRHSGAHRSGVGSEYPRTHISPERGQRDLARSVCGLPARLRAGPAT